MAITITIEHFGLILAEAGTLKIETLGGSVGNSISIFSEELSSTGTTGSRSFTSSVSCASHGWSIILNSE